jgi:hypothetical protein
MKDKINASQESTKRKEIHSLSYKRKALKELEEGHLTVKEFIENIRLEDQP